MRDRPNTSFCRGLCVARLRSPSSLGFDFCADGFLLTIRIPYHTPETSQNEPLSPTNPPFTNEQLQHPLRQSNDGSDTSKPQDVIPQIFGQPGGALPAIFGIEQKLLGHKWLGSGTKHWDPTEWLYWIILNSIHIALKLLLKSGGWKTEVLTKWSVQTYTKSASHWKSFNTPSQPTCQNSTKWLA